LFHSMAIGIFNFVKHAKTSIIDVELSLNILSYNILLFQLMIDISFTSS